MANFANLKAAINAVIKQNGQGEITGEVMNQVLTAMVNSLGSNYQFAGVATPSTNPGTPDQNVFYMATQAGTYTNFSAIVLQAGISILLWDGSWSSETFFEIDSVPTSSSDNFISSGAVFDKFKLDGGAYDVSAHNSNQTFASLSALLSDANLSTLIPTNIRSGGMSIKFVQSSDNKYAQYRLMADSWSIDINNWAIADEGVYVENHEFLYVKTDAKDRILWAIKEDGSIYYGAGVPQQVKDYIEEKIAVLSLDEYEDIVAFLSDYLGSDTTLKVMIDGINAAKVDKEEGKSLIDAEYANGVHYIENLEFAEVKMDADDRILEAILKDGTKILPAGVKVGGTAEYEGATIKTVENPEFMEVEIDAEEKILGGRRKDNTAVHNGDFELNGDLNVRGPIETPFVKTEEIELSQEGIAKLKEDLEIHEPTPVVSVNDDIEIAAGKQRSYGTYKSELESSPFNDSSSNYYIKDKTIGKDHTVKSVNKKFVVMNHDDGELSDLIATRKIYNKYGFTGNFCCIFNGFTSLADAKSRIENGRKLLKEGHAIGLHAIMAQSYWYANRVYDVKPDGSSNFAPLLSEIQGDNPDGTGTNAFGKTITADTLASEVYYMSTPASVIPELNIKVVDLTQEQVNRLNRQYCLYSDEWTGGRIDDLAIDDIMSAESADTVSKSRIAWIEYYYNGLIDNTLGYSSTAASIADKFAEDYSVPSGASVSDYYPDAAHLKNGKMVYWNDTTNAHYAEAKAKTVSGFSDSDYQLVGKFTKGLYKDCFSTMNFEVMDRCVAAAEAFFRKYYGLNHFAEFHIHGVHYLNFYYQNTDGSIYADREKQFIYYPTAKWYSSKIGTFKSVSDIMADFGMSMMKDGLRRFYVKWQGSFGYYYKVDGIRNEIDDFNNGSTDAFGYTNTNYLNTFGVTDEGGRENMDYNTFMQFLEGVDDWTKFIYENAGTNVTRNGLTMRVYSHLRASIMKCIGSIGTGAVPVFSVDTIRKNPAMSLAVELLFRFLKANGFEVLNFAEGKKKLLSVRRSISGNQFPNPSFEQSTLRCFGGSSISKYAYVPDGWIMSIQGNSSSVSLAVAKETIDSSSVPVLSIGGYIIIQTSIWGLPAGDYKLSYWAKGSDASVVTKVCKNSDLIDDDTNAVDSFSPTSEWTEHTVDITIPEFHRNAIDGNDFYNVVCDGYEDNVCCIIIRVQTTNNASSIKLASPRLIVK